MSNSQAARAGQRRVVVAMSGGVDSSVAAVLVTERGDEAIGITLHLAGSDSRCCSLADADDARRVAEGLGLRFFVANYRERFQEEVVEAFADAYLAGRTPIPCLACMHLCVREHLRVHGCASIRFGFAFAFAFGFHCIVPRRACVLWYTYAMCTCTYARACARVP